MSPEHDTGRPSLRHGRQALSIPGPSVMPDSVLAAMHRPMPNIYEGDLVELSTSVLDDLPKIAHTTGTPYITISNGHGAWEMALTNTLSRGDKVLVLESGRFAVVWGEMASLMGVDVEVLPAPDPSTGVGAARIALRASRPPMRRLFTACSLITPPPAAICWEPIIGAAGQPTSVFATPNTVYATCSTTGLRPRRPVDRCPRRPDRPAARDAVRCV